MFNAENYNRAIINELSVIDKETRQEIAFVPKRAQVDLGKHMEDALQIIVLKARKMGFSSYVLAVWTIAFLFGENVRAVSVSYEKGSAVDNLERVKGYLRAYERKNGKLQYSYNNRNEIVIDKVGRDGNPVRNTFLIGSAESDSFGRGKDITHLHIAETAFCKDIYGLLASVGTACVPGAFKIFESTANGFNDFKKFWDDAKDGKNGFLPLFYGSDWEYSPEFIQERRNELGRLGPQEFPMTEEEAFLTSGELYIDGLILGEYLTKCKEPINFQFV